MFGVIFIRRVGILALFFFVFFIFIPDFAAAGEKEDILVKARQLYQEGDYEGSLKLLSDFVKKQEGVEGQKKNRAEAFYLMARIYFELGEDARVIQYLRNVFQIDPDFDKAEVYLRFKELVDSVRESFQEKPPTKPRLRVIEQPAERKRKKFPVLLVVGGVVVVAVVILLLKKKKKEEVYDIRGDWTMTEYVPGNETVNVTYRITFSGDTGMGTVTNYNVETLVDAKGSGTYIVLKDSVRWTYDGYEDREFRGNFKDQNLIEGSTYYYIMGIRFSYNWRATRGYSGG